MKKQDALNIIAQVLNHFGGFTMAEAMKAKEAFEFICTLEEPKKEDKKPIEDTLG